MAPGCFATPSQELNESESRPTGSENLAKNLIIFTGDEKINLEEIPLPAEPAPPLSQIVLLNHQLNKQQSETKVNLKKKNSPKIIYDTVDSFEVLEQTIMKQKRLARLKNTDLRRKILLKRTFDLVCEIMDYENGFEADTPSSSSSESDSDEESEKNDLLEEPSVKTNLTLVKLDSEQGDTDHVYFALSEVDEESKAQAEVPKKRRASHSDSDEEDYSDDESDHFALKEQQLDSVNSSLDSLHAQLNLYCENRKKSSRKKRRLCDKLGAKSLSIALKA
ncbi:hypothetical protein BpHYR1_011743 [Brachionus plicatilis]|uniref:Uncharacterized protein n=1 Tax=Brachionus plicatilis TaxID=10195 RepID=A0A3M7P8G3_BRAPC|nr:hypothetical protein BpHYR1_011743 [Brachionus plicatilis]